MAGHGEGSGAWRTAAAVVGCALLALLLTYPLVLEPASAIVSHWIIDAEHALWIQWWFATAVESSQHTLFETDRIRYPDRVDLQLADLNLAVNFGLYLLGRIAGRIAAYNVALWGSFVASAWMLAVFARRVCGDEGAAWFAGLAFAASSYWLSTALDSWMYLVHIWVLPLSLWTVWQAAARQRLRDFVAAGLAAALTFHVSPYYFLFLVALLLALAPEFARDLAPALRDRAVVGRALAGGLVAFGAIAPRAWAMVGAGQGDYFVHTAPDDTVLAARPLEFLWPYVARPDRESYGMFMVVFLGYTTTTLAVAGAIRRGSRRACLRWLVPAGLMFVLALGPSWRGVPLPGAVLSGLPGFEWMTNHWRWSLPGTLCVCVAAAISLAEIRRSRADLRAWIAPVATAMLLAEVLLVFPFPFEKALWRPASDPISVALRDSADVEVVLDLREHPKLHQMTHGKRIVGGWLPRLERSSVEHTRALLGGLTSQPRERIRYLGGLGIDAVVLDDATAFRIEPDPRTPGAFRRVPLAEPGR